MPQHYHARHHTPDHATCAAAGDATVSIAHPQVERAAGDLTRLRAKLREPRDGGHAAPLEIRDRPRVRPAHTTRTVRDHGVAAGGALPRGRLHPLFAKLRHAATAAPTTWTRQSEGWHSCAARRRRYSAPRPAVSDGPATFGEHSPPRGVVAISCASVAPCGGPTPAEIVAMRSRSLIPRGEKVGARATPARMTRGLRGRARYALSRPSRDEQPPRRLVTGCPEDSGQCADRGGQRADDEQRAPLFLRGAGEEFAVRLKENAP